MRPVAAFALLVLAATPALADQLEDLLHEIADAHVALASKLEKVGNRPEARAELLLAITLEPDHATARTKLGYERTETGWRGSPPPAAAARAPLKGALLKERDDLHKKSALRIAKLAQATVNPDEVRRIAGLALEEDQDSNLARELLGHERRHPLWLSQRALKLKTAFDKAREKTETKGRETDSPEEKELEGLLKLGGLVRHEAPHAIFLATKASGESDLASLARALEVTRASWRHFLGEGDQGFGIDGEPERKAEDTPLPAGKKRPRWLIVAAAEHKDFIERAITDKTRHDLARKLKSWSGPVDLPSGKLFLYEASLAPAYRAEWVTLTTVKTLILQSVPATKVACPGFLVEGFTRFFGGHVTGKAELSYVSAKTSTSGQDRKAVTFDEFRGGLRAVLSSSLEGDLRRLVSKSLNELDDADSALAFAFVEWALEKKRPELRSLVTTLKADETPLVALERVFGKSPEALEQELRDWIRQEY